MSSTNLLDKVKKLREVTGVGFKDCKNAIDECGGDIEKSIEFLRKKGIAKATKKMERVASEGLIAIHESENKIAIVEINCETDFVAKNEEFISFAEKISRLALLNKGNIEKILISEMDNKKKVQDNLVSLISKIGEKITIRRSTYFDEDNSVNFHYIHTSLKKNIGKLGVLINVETTIPKTNILDLGHKLAMHVAAINPLSINIDDLDSNILKKEEEIIKEELKNNGKKANILDKITKGKLNKFINENTLLNQEWIMDPKKRVKDVIKEYAGDKTLKVKKFIRYKVGEGV